MQRSVVLRSGATLSEILIALLVMAVGVSSLLVLFPISVLRAVQATNLTHATQLRYNAESLQDLARPFRDGGQLWQPRTNFEAGRDWVVPNNRQFRLAFPQLLLRCTTTGQSGGVEPLWNPPFPGSTFPDNTAEWTMVRLDRFFVDPNGWWEMQTIGNTDYRDAVGQEAFSATRPALRTGGVPLVWRLSGNIPSRTAAQRVAGLPDSFLSFGEYKVLGPGVAGEVLLEKAGAQAVELNPARLGDAIPRVTLSDAGRRTSLTRRIAAVAAVGSNLRVTLADPDPPAGLFDPGVSNRPTWGRLEVSEPRYSVLYSIRRGAGVTTLCDVVVFFRRSYSQDDEAVFPALVTSCFDLGRDGGFGTIGVDDDLNGTTDDASERGAVGSDDPQRNWVIVQFDRDRRPQMKKGGFVCDYDNLRWYRVLDVVEGPDPNAAPVKPASTNDSLTFPAVAPLSAAPYAVTNARYARLTLDRPVESSGRLQSAAQASPQQTQFFGRLVFMKNVVDVYPLEPLYNWDNN